ncbi:MAG: hypothetical protein OES57_18330 [Acidimicrobiia bacterium]|nr:hypothetical protein [Acidimicrobiia bacterium]
MATPPPAHRHHRWLLTVVVVAALLVPVLRDHDSFPLSTYPMYAHNRDRDVAFATVVGVTADEQIVRLGLTTIADSDDALEAASLVRAEVRSGRAADLCRVVATRVDEQLVRVEVVTETHDAVAHTRGEASLLGREVHATCPVGP